MTKDTNSAHSERLMVYARVRPMEFFREGHRAVAVLDSQTLVFMEPSSSSEKIDPEHHFGRGSGSHGYPGSNTRINRTHHAPTGHNLNNGFHHHQHNQQQQKYHQPQTAEGRLYEFDYVFEENASQEEVYKNTAAPLVRSVMEGFCATVFAYGATGSGKTYTMIGTQANPGIMARAVDEIFHLCSKQKTDSKAEVYLSYLEVYNEQIRDLLRPSGLHLDLREDKEQVHVAGLSEIRATSTHEVLNLLQKGNRARTMEATAANVTSSRSHAVLQVTVRQLSLQNGEITEGKLYLIDLAGSERASNTKNSGIRLREGAHINRSLLALGNCITALATGDGDRYINYRDSKLTRLLKAALGGPSKTAMIAHVTPAFHQVEETRNTLLYAQRARAISNRVRKFIYNPNQPDATMVIQELRNEVKRLQLKLEQRDREAAQAPKTPKEPDIDYSDLNPTMNLPLHLRKELLGKHEKPNLSGIKTEITGLFEEEFRLRNDLLKLDGAMLQSALDCEILRLMVLDWENLKSAARDSDGEGASSEDSDHGKNEINSVMVELKQVRSEQKKLVRLRGAVEHDLKAVRARIAQVEEAATQFLPEVQREILSLLCKLQQDQVQKMSIEIESELKRRGTLLLRCLRQKALGEAIIHRQRHYISGNKAKGVRESVTPRDTPAFLPPLKPPNSGERPAVHQIKCDVHPSPGPQRIKNSHLPPIPTNIPTTTKYSDFRRSRPAQQQLRPDVRNTFNKESSSDDEEIQILDPKSNVTPKMKPKSQQTSSRSHSRSDSTV